RFVVQVARSFPDSCGLSMGDRIAEGNCGLVDAVRRYDPAVGVKFISYAVWWIEQAIRKAAENSHPVRIPSNTIRDALDAEKTRSLLQSQQGYDPSPEQVSEASGVPLERMERAHQALRPMARLDGDPSTDGLPPLSELIPDPEARRPDEEIEQRDLADAIQEALGQMPEREAYVVEAYAGLRPEDGGQKNLAELGEQLGLCRERVRQIRNHGHETLRRKLQAYAEYGG
ncbi:MAG: sigma-70 family RNA polymerase sigma factor, partial [Acidobacteriota bacterium]